MNKDKETAPADFLEDTPVEGVSYITPNIEIKLPAHKRMECRNIVAEIKKFGVNQRQILYTIYLLALELEDNATMKAITKAVGDNRENIKLSNLVLDADE